MNAEKIGIIGLGVMGNAILSGMIAAKVISASAVVVFDKKGGREYEQGDGYAHTTSFEEMRSCAFIIIAVKPHDLRKVLSDLRSVISESCVVVSIAAGVTTKTIDEILCGKGRIVRVMPNTPVILGRGVSAVCKGPRADDKDIVSVKRLFQAIGSVYVVEESDFDLISALSGSGPAYFFYVIEGMVDAAVARGLDRDIALSLSRETFEGAAALLVTTHKPPSLLRKEVTSPKGSTAEAIAVFEKRGLHEIFASAIDAAVERNKEMGRE